MEIADSLKVKDQPCDVSVNESVYTYYTEATEADGAATMNNSVMIDDNALGTQDSRRDVQVEADLETNNRVLNLFPDATGNFVDNDEIRSSKVPIITLDPLYS